MAPAGRPTHHVGPEVRVQDGRNNQGYTGQEWHRKEEKGPTNLNGIGFDSTEQVCGIEKYTSYQGHDSESLISRESWLIYGEKG